MAVETQSISKRADLSVEFTWDLSLIFRDDEVWEEALAAMESRQPEIVSLQGTLHQGASALLHVLQTSDDVAIQLERLVVYARMRQDQDGTDPVGGALVDRSGSVAARTSAALSFIEPEILALPAETLSAWQREELGLPPYAYFLEHLARTRPHVRTAEVESVIAQFREVTRAPSEIAQVLSSTELVFPTIEDEQGRPAQLSDARYLVFVSSADRRVRHDAFMGIYKTYEGVQRTFASSLSATVRNHALNARLRDYPSALAAALQPSDIPLEVYGTLVDTVQANLPRLHRYLRVRRKMLAVDDLHYYDLYAPLVPELKDAFDYTAARDMVQAGLSPLGSEYSTALEESLTSRWIDVYENFGKRGGAYSGGTYTTPPFILMNYQGKLSDVYTLAHELGHSLHSYFSARSQPYVSGSYTIFLAEVASNLAEALLTAHLLSTRDDRALRKQLIVEQIEAIRTSIFRQTMFAEFELDMHQRVEAGDALTAESLSERYRALVERYHGSGLTIDDEVAVEWVRIPHFYLNFYVYQYATGIAAAIALSKQILSEGEPAVQRYLNFLRSGSSRPSIELLRDAGVDMASPEPVQLAMDHFDSLLDELEAMG